MSTTRRSFPIAKDIAFNLSRENFPPGKRYEVTITYDRGLMNLIDDIETFPSTLLAPASIQDFAFFSFIPPPT